MHDIDVRIVLKAAKLSHFYSDNNSLVVDEMGIFEGESRIDVAVINGSLYGYEIKSDSDTLYRLESQLGYYSQVFDYLTYVVGSRHKESAMDLIPVWCGIIIATGTDNGVTLKEIRKPKKNKGVQALAIAQLLWKDELIDLLYTKGIRGLSGKKKNDLQNLLVENFSLKELSQVVRKKLRSRSGWRVDPAPYVDGGLYPPSSM